MPDDIAAILAAAVGRDPARPLLTWYDDATGERTELSGATLANWAAKTANLLVDGLGLVPGDRAGVLLPPHWQTAGVLLGCWSAGLTVGPPPDVVFAAPDRIADADAPDRFVVSMHPFALPMREVPPGWLDYNLEVRAYGDHFAPSAPAVVAGDPRGLTAADRVLIDADAHPDPGTWLVGPLAAGATIVLCGHLDRSTLDARVAAEQVTAIWR